MSPHNGLQRVRFGLNMHPRWLSGEPASMFLTPLRQLGLTALEFKVDMHDPDWPETEALIEDCQALGFALSFHAPHGDVYALNGFTTGRGPEIKNRWAPAVSFVAGIADQFGPSTLVLHGAKGDEPRRRLRRDTVAFARWVLRRSKHLRIALEVRIRERGTVKVGDSRAELVDLVSELGSERVGICWDLGHDVRNGFSFTGVDWGFVSHVTHVHVHDVSPDGRDHYPLVFDNVPYQDCLKLLLEAGYRGNIILEIDGCLVGALAREMQVSPLCILHQSVRRLGELPSAQMAGEPADDPRAGAGASTDDPVRSPSGYHRG